jgi:hypothetical protein
MKTVVRETATQVIASNQNAASSIVDFVSIEPESSYGQ